MIHLRETVIYHPTNGPGFCMKTDVHETINDVRIRMFQDYGLWWSLVELVRNGSFFIELCKE